MNWISHPVTLKGKNVTLVPLNTSHIDSLIEVASDRQIWKHYAIDGSDPAKLRPSLEASLRERDAGKQYAFVITLTSDNRIMGSTRFLDIQPDHRKLEIGWTWLHPAYWGTKLNTECKFLLLSYCFENLSARRVQLKTDENNTRSRKAILKIGASFEGILRNDMVRDNGTNRNSAYYSIIDTEWSTVRKHLLSMLEQG